MKITKSQLRKMIKEEIAKTLKEGWQWDASQEDIDLNKVGPYKGASAEESIARIQGLADGGRIQQVHADKAIADADGDPEKLNHTYQELWRHAARQEDYMRGMPDSMRTAR